MATESPLFSHSQCTAGVNMSNTAGLAGMNGSGQFLALAMTATSRSVGLATAASVVTGILQNDPLSGQAANVGFSGVSKAMLGAGGATAGNMLIPTATSAFAVGTTVAGSITVQALETGVAGQVITVLLS